MLERIKKAAFARLAPTSVYVRRIYRRKTGEPLNLDNPVKFNEKLQWLKLNYRDPVLTKMADKYAAKRFVSEKLGADLSVPTAALFERAEDIVLDPLPHRLALKATHGSGWNIISRDKSELDEEKVRAYFKFWLSKNYYVYSKEWAYRNIKPRVICEPLLIDGKGELPLDYKVFCFDGIARFVQVDFDRFTEHTRAFYDQDWVKQPFSVGYPLTTKTVEAPNCLNQMLDAAERLASGLPFLRVDQYVLDGRAYIGELTIYPGNGMERFSDESWNKQLGSLITLPSRI